MKTELADEKCVEAGDKQLRLKKNEIQIFRKQIAKWELVKGKILEKKFKFPDFKQALQYTVKVGKLADKQGHHPDCFLTYGGVRIQLSTHSAKRAHISHSTLAPVENKLMKPALDMLLHVYEAMETNLWPHIRHAEERSQKPRGQWRPVGFHVLMLGFIRCQNGKEAPIGILGRAPDLG